MLHPDPMHQLWRTPIGLHQFDQAANVNDTLLRVFAAMRATDEQADNASPFYASKDDLLQRIRLGEWQQLLAFIVDGLRQTVVLANHGHWPQATPSLQIALQGIWFQVSNSSAHHDIHTHGNCSWSGVYCLQVDDEQPRQAHAVHGVRNGVTRFYGPHFNHLAGAAMDFGNAYLQAAHVDVQPVPGQLVVFPSWLAHQAMPYDGAKDRVIVSFNATIHSASGSDQVHGYSAG